MEAKDWRRASVSSWGPSTAMITDSRMEIWERRGGANDFKATHKGEIVDRMVCRFVRIIGKGTHGITNDSR